MPLSTDETRFLPAPAHPWARAGRVQRETVANETLILFSNQTSYTFRPGKACFRAEAMPLANSLERGSMEAIK